MYSRSIPTVGATLSLLVVAACGGGGGGTSTSLSPVSTGAYAEAARAVPVAGSVTQSSDTSQGITANAVAARVSLDSRGLVTGDVQGKDWRFRNERAWYRERVDGWEVATFVRRLGDGGGRTVAIVTDRARAADTIVQDGDVWVSSNTHEYDDPDYYNVIYSGVSGTLNGVAGTLVCYGDSNCDEPLAFMAPEAPPGDPGAGTEPDGTVGPFSGNPYEFGPASGFRFVRGSDAQNPPADSDYLVLGYWHRVPGKHAEHVDEYGALEAGDLSAEFYKDLEYGVFVSGSDPFAQTGITALTGSAVYNGDAFAVYRDTNIDPRTDKGKDSQLDADVTLTANFGGRTENGTISGTISNFRLPYEPFDNDLTTFPSRLTLGSAPIGDSHSGFFTGDTAMTFDGSAFAGKWGGQFYGNGEADGRPGSAAGTFGAATTDESKVMIGMFGAYKR